jgi:hypothetical protein
VIAPAKLAADEADAEFVEVRRQWNDSRTAKYRISDVDNWHWSSVSGGVNAVAIRDFVHGYVMCDGAVSGEVAHSCNHGPPPHSIKVCIIKSGNEAVWDRVLQLAGPRRVSPTDPAQLERKTRKRRFLNRGLSAITIRKLLEAGIDAPERLLFMCEADVKALHGIGPARLGEINEYRTKYTPANMRAPMVPDEVLS